MTTEQQTTTTQPRTDEAREEVSTSVAVDDRVRDEARRILNETQDAIHEVEAGVDQINELMVELLFLGGLSVEAQTLANDLGAEANALFAGLELQAEALRKEVAAAAGDDDEDDDAV
jgi:hypothetical protein